MTVSPALATQTTFDADGSPGFVSDDYVWTGDLPCGVTQVSFGMVVDLMPGTRARVQWEFQGGYTGPFVPIGNATAATRSVVFSLANPVPGQQVVVASSWLVGGRRAALHVLEEFGNTGQFQVRNAQIRVWRDPDAWECYAPGGAGGGVTAPPSWTPPPTPTLAPGQNTPPPETPEPSDQPVCVRPQPAGVYGPPAPTDCDDPLATCLSNCPSPSPTATPPPSTLCSGSGTLNVGNTSDVFNDCFVAYVDAVYTVTIVSWSSNGCCAQMSWSGAGNGTIGDSGTTYFMGYDNDQNGVASGSINWQTYLPGGNGGGGGDPAGFVSNVSFSIAGNQAWHDQYAGFGGLHVSAPMDVTIQSMFGGAQAAPYSFTVELGSDPGGHVPLPSPTPSPSGVVDSDGDGFTDAYENGAGTNPNDPNDYPDPYNPNQQLSSAGPGSVGSYTGPQGANGTGGRSLGQAGSPLGECEPEYPKGGQVVLNNAVSPRAPSDPLDVPRWIGDMVGWLGASVANGLLNLWNGLVDLLVPSQCLFAEFEAFFTDVETFGPFAIIGGYVNMLDSVDFVGATPDLSFEVADQEVEVPLAWAASAIGPFRPVLAFAVVAVAAFAFLDDVVSIIGGATGRGVRRANGVD